MNRKKLATKRDNRKMRVRNKLKANSDLPRLVITRSLKHISAQVVDKEGRVLATATSKGQSSKGQTKTEQAGEVGKTMSVKLKTKNITAVVFDRGCHRYHGRIKALAEAVIEGLLPKIKDFKQVRERTSRDSQDKQSKIN